MADVMDCHTPTSTTGILDNPEHSDTTTTRFTRHWNENEAIIREIDSMSAIEHMDCTAEVWELLRALLDRFKHHAAELYRENKELKAKITANQVTKLSAGS